MNPDPDLEKLIDGELKKLPAPQAPASIKPRVRAAIETLQARRGFHFLRILTTKLFPGNRDMYLPLSPAQAARRFWLTATCFAAANLVAWIGYHHYYQTGHDTAVGITQFSPGNKVLVGPRPTFSWQFDRDLASRSGKSEASAAAINWLSITPPVPGHWHWSNNQTLCFTPSVDLPKATRFTLNLSESRLRQATGLVLAKPFTATVDTAPLQVVDIRQAANDGDQFILELEFNDKVLPSDVLSHLRIKGPGEKTISARLHGEAAGPIVRVITDGIHEIRNPDWREKASLTVALTPGLGGASGPLGLAQAFEQNLKLNLGVVVTKVEADCPARGHAHLNLQFNTDVKPELLQPLITVEPAVPFTVSNEDWRANRVELDGDFQPGNRYVVKITSPAGKFNPASVPQPGTFSVFVPNRAAGVWFEHEAGYLGSAGNRMVMAHVVNYSELQLTITRVYDNNLIAWCNLSGQDRDGVGAYAQPVLRKKIPMPMAKNRVQDLPLSLDDLLPPDAPRDSVYCFRIETDPSADASGHDPNDENRYWYRSERLSTASTLVTLSDIGLTAKRTRESLRVWAVSLSTAKPLANTRVRLFSSKNQPLGEAITNAEGLATLPAVHPADGEEAALLLADLGGESSAPARSRGLTWLSLEKSALNLANHDIGGPAYLRTGHEAFLYTDRGVYRPGELVHLRAIVRGPDTETPQAFPVRWQIRRPDRRDWKSEVKLLDADGASGWDLQLPADLPTGRWSAQVGLPGESGPHAQFFGTVAFQVEEFIPDRMKVALKLNDVDGTQPLRLPLNKKPITVQVQGDYLFGQPAADRKVKVVSRLDPAKFEPEGAWKDWTFGDAAQTATILGEAKPEGYRLKPFDAQLDDHGQASFEFNLQEYLKSDAAAADEENEDEADNNTDSKPKSHRKPNFLEPWRLTVTASVQELGGRAVSTVRQVTVDKLPYYIGIRPQKSGAARPGEPFAFDAALIQPDGTVSGKDAEIETTLFRETWNNTLTYKDGHYHYDSTRRLETPAKDAVTAFVAYKGHGTILITPPSNGTYVCRFRDTRTGAVTTHAFNVSNGSFWEDNISRENPEQLELVLLPTSAELPKPDDKLPRPAKSEFRVGDQAQVIVRSPFAGRLLLTVETDDVVTSRVIEMPASQAAVPITITEACRPNAYVCASVIRAIDPNVKWRTHRAFGAARLLVSSADRRLNINVATVKETRPRQSFGVDLRVTDESGKPVSNAGVTLAAVDEGICQLTRFTTPDPLAFFNTPRSLGVKLSDLYSQLMPEVGKPTPSSSVGGDSEYDPRHRSPVAARRVRPVALVSPVLHSDADGKVHADFQLPEFTGQLRVMAVSYAAKTFGSTDQSVLVRSPLLLQSSWPRFAAPNDRFAVPMTIFNNTGSTGKAEITVELESTTSGESSPLNFRNGGERKLTLPPVQVAAGGQNTINLEITAAAAAGVARAKIVARLNNESYEESTELPVRPASPMISRGGSAVAQPDQPAKITIPTEMLAGTRKLEVRATPWPSLELPGGLDYLDRYPYGCVEQVTSTLFPLVYLHDIGEQIAPGMFEKTHIDNKVQIGITKLIGMQTADGGLAMWPAYRETWPWASVYVAHFLLEAETAGHKVPEDFRNHLLAYVRNLLNKSAEDADLLETQAYACYVLALAGKPERAIMNRLGEILNAPKAPEGAAQSKLFLAAAWLNVGRRDLASALIPADLPQPRQERRLGGALGSAVRDRAILINTLLAVQPDHPALPGLVQQLADAGRAGAWGSTQDTAFAVMALGRYLRQSKNAVPFETVELWANGQKLAGSSGGQPLTWTAPTTASNKTAYELRATGPTGSKAHIGWLQIGVPLQMPEAGDHGLKIRRRYLDEKGNPLPAPAVVSGQLIQVELTIEGSAGQDNIVIEDLLPAGLEIENPRLETAAKKRVRNGEEDPNKSKFVDQRLEVRDDRLVLIGKMVETGEAKYSYWARAVAPGTYAVPPVRAECMYDIGTCSLAGGNETLTVKPAEAPIKVAQQ